MSKAPSPPPKSSEQIGSEAKVSWGGLILAAFGLIVVLLIFLNSGDKPSRSTSSDSGSGSGSFKLPLVSKALDEKNGFKSFKFGITPKEAREILAPSTISEDPRKKTTFFHYQATSVNRIGEFLTDIVSLTFFDDHLHRIDIGFSSFPNEILEACKVNYGEPRDSDSWRRGDQKLRAKSWQGEKVAASILSLPDQAWDLLIIYDILVNQKAQEYGAKEPERAAKDFGPDGFKWLLFGMKLQDITFKFDVLEDDRVTAVKKVAFKKGDWLSVGFYPLKTLSAEFFNDKLYRIDFSFEENQKEMYETFKYRFGSLQDNDTWTRGTMKLKAKSVMHGKLFATILAPSISYGSSDNWDAIVLFDYELWQQTNKFKKDAPKRAAKDF